MRAHRRRSGATGLLLLCRHRLAAGDAGDRRAGGALGCRRVILASGWAAAWCSLPGHRAQRALLALTLFLFGATIGTLDVAMNVQAVIVEKDYGGALMSGFHGMFSVGGIVGAGSMSAMLWQGWTSSAHRWR
jgi:fucose permease